MAPIQLTAIITPKPGKADRFLQLFQNCVEYVQKNEPYIHRYELHEGIPDKKGNQKFIVLEGYDNQEGLDKHMKAPPVLALIKAVGEEKLTDTEIVMTKDGPGVKSRL